jgi:4-hydroxy-3-polyprenylbenzoate decarboxylase
MPFTDVREFISKLEKENEAVQIEKEVSWNLEAGAMLRYSIEAKLPAPFFKKITDYSTGYTVFGNMLSNFRRIAIAMDINPDIPPRELMGEYIKREKHPIKPILVDEGPCKENIDTGEKVDLFKFPIPLIHEGDGGRYIGTWDIVVTKDMDSGWVNWGMYRIMVHDKKTVAMHAGPYTHLGTMLSSYQDCGKAMKAAIVIGTEPISTMCAAAPIPHGISEADIAGGIRKQPIELVKCETLDLLVPATAEIVIEGEIRPGELREEGPFGEFSGYIVSPKSPAPVFHVEAVTHRNNPILCVSCAGVPVYDEHAMGPIIQGAEYLEALRKRGLPVTSVNMLPECSNHLLVISTKTPYAMIAEEIAHVVWGTRGGRYIPYLIIVNDDVDPFDTTQVFHALATKCHPYRGIIKQEKAVGIPLFPWANRYERDHGIGARAYFDCTWPLEWDKADIPRRVSFNDLYSDEMQKTTVKIWKEHGY